MTQRKTHWLRQNAANRIPRRLVVFDSESRQQVTKSQAEHSFRLAVASFDELDPEGNPLREPVYIGTEKPATLWGWVSAQTRTAHRTVCFAHNLSFDLRLSNALHELPALGWQCKGIGLNTYSCWARFRNGSRTLWLCDSLSYLPVSVEKLASALRMDKPPLPADDAPIEEWWARCEGDVRVTREAILRVLRFIREEELGDFRLTGAGQATAAFRHRFLPAKSLLVHSDEPALVAERRAAWTGRAEVWKHGEHTRPLYEYDYENAYARIALENELPTRLIAEHSPIPWPRLERVMEHYAVLAEVEISTDLPCVPTLYNDHIVWPTGEFQSILWDSELSLLRDGSNRIQLRRFWYYKRSDILRSWAEWILGKLNDDAAQLDPVIRFMLKDWSRALIGRFGLRYSNLDEIAQLQSSDVRLFGVHDADDGRSLMYMQLGQQLLEHMERVESPDSLPMIMGAVMSAARVKLWEAMTEAGLNNVYYVDTDGIVVDSDGAKRLDLAISGSRLSGLRRKAEYHHAVFRSPRNADFGETRRVSGAPRRAERLAPGIYRGEVWESLPTALRRHRPGGVFVHERTFNVSETDPRRLHLEDGSTAAIELSLEDRESEPISA